MNHQKQQQQPPPALPASRSSLSSGDCGNCGAHVQGLLLHNVRLRGIQRRLCATCVLRLHPSQFCPVCFAFYDSNPPHPSKRFSCSKCASFTHSHCLSSPPPPPPYLCPPCSAPSPASFSFFPNSAVADGGGRKIDSKYAAVLLCAARIASASMAKAVAVARMEAEKKAKEAAVARKRAREALERVGMLMNVKNNVNFAQNNGNGGGGVGGGGGGDGSAAASFFKQEVVNNVETETG